MDGPVVIDAKAALEKKDVTAVLKWVPQHSESEIRSAFSRTLGVRAKGAEARELADQFFFETLVRIHRAGEGAPYTGLKPAGTKVEPAVAEADRALQNGSADRLVKIVTEEAASGIRRRLAAAHAKKAHAEHTVEAGRDFVAAYVEYVHYVEGLHQAAQGVGAHHGSAAPAACPADGAHQEHQEHPAATLKHEH